MAWRKFVSGEWRKILSGERTGFVSLYLISLRWFGCWRCVEIAAGEGDEGGPVGGGGVASAVLAEGYVAVDERGFHWREGCGVEAFFAEEGVDGAGCGGSHEHALGVRPAVAFGGASADEDGAGGAEGDEFVGVDREIFPLQGAGVLEEVA